MKKFPTITGHSDESIPVSTRDVTPPISVSTTYLFSENGDNPYLYSRDSHPTRSRTEKIIGDLEGGHAVTYSSGLSAIHACIVHFMPKRILIDDGGYHGTHGVIDLLKKRTQIKVADLTSPIQSGDMVWLESPKNPSSQLYDIQEFCKRAHRVGAIVCVDATFAPPPIQFTLKLGADVSMHSTTKYFGGHSDLLGGVLIVKDQETKNQLLQERLIMGCVPGSLESWLLLRSLRTLEIRVNQQCQNAAIIAKWLESDENKQFVEKVYHLSLPSHPDHLLAKKQMNGFGAMIAIETREERMAPLLPQKLKIFKDATSLGGVESLIDWRYKWDQKVSKKLLRISIGLEHAEDLIQDFRQAFSSLQSRL